MGTKPGEQDPACVPNAKYTLGEFSVSALTSRRETHGGSEGGREGEREGEREREREREREGRGRGREREGGRERERETETEITEVISFQVIRHLMRVLPNGSQRKREVDYILDKISETMTPMHYHSREVIFSTFSKVKSEKCSKGQICKTIK